MFKKGLRKMTEKKTINKFMFYENFFLAIEKLPEEKRAKACYEFCKYGITGELPDDENLAMFCIGVSASIQKYQGRGGFREGSGRKPKESKKSKESKESETTNINLNRNINNKHKIENIIKEIKNDRLEKELKKYIDFRKERKNPLTETNLEYVIKKLDKITGKDDDLKIKIIQQSLENGWLGLFPLKNIQKKEDDSFLEEMVKQQNERLGLK